MTIPPTSRRPTVRLRGSRYSGGSHSHRGLHRQGGCALKNPNVALPCIAPVIRRPSS